MGHDKETVEMQAKIIMILARIFDLPAGVVNGSTILADFFSDNPDGLRTFVVKLEDALQMPLGEKAVDSCRTVGELAAYCAAHKESMQAGRGYIIVCRMPGGKICERHYRAKRHEDAAQLAMDDGAEEILSVEREDLDEEFVRKKVGVWSVLMLPLILGLLVALVGVAVFWWRRGCPKFW